jgi:hypothetical protein
MNNQWTRSKAEISAQQVRTCELVAIYVNLEDPSTSFLSRLLRRIQIYSLADPLDRHGAV